MCKRKYNIVVFGATGVSGKDMIEEISKYLESAPADKKFTWAVAGRNVKKLEEVLIEMSGFLRKDLSGIDIIKADVEDAESLRDMASKCDVVLNFVGPYLLYGEAVVKACVAEGTHHLDLSIEEQYLEGMQLKYHQEAQKSGAIIVGGAGPCSILSDYGSTYLAENFDGQLNSVESYINAFTEIRKVPEMHYGTFNSTLLFLHRYSELKSIRRQLYPDYPDAYYKFKYPFQLKNIRYSRSLESWCAAVPFPDLKIMDRTQKYKFYERKEKPIQCHVFIQLPNLFYAFLMAFGVRIVFTILSFKFILKFCRKHPRISTLGFATKEPVHGKGADTPFSFTLIGRGWDKESDPDADPPNKKMILKIRGKDCSHSGTVIPMLQAGLSLIYERETIALSGGVYTPGTAFAGTTLAERIGERGLTFKFEKE